MAHLVDTLQNGSIYEMDFPITDAIGMHFERLKGRDLWYDFRDVGESREAKLSPNCEFFGGLRMQ